MKIIKKNYPVFLIVLLCAVIIAIWFKDGKFLATGEEGLVLLNPSRTIDLYQYSWNEIGTGIAAPGTNAMVPLFYFESWLLNLRLPLWLFQAFIFFLLMSLGAVSVYFLSKELLKEYIKTSVTKVAFVAAIFYILNPISMLGVWYRFILGFMFFYCLAPLFFYLYVIGVNKRRKAFIFLGPLVALFFTFSFESPAPVLLLWLLPFIYSIFLSLPHASKKGFNIFPLGYFISSALFWLIINLWWIYPYIELSKISFAGENSVVHAVGTLKANSLDFTLPNVVRLIHGGFLYKGEAFGNIYKTPLFLILSWLIPLITLYGLIKLRSGQIKKFFIYGLILLLFLAKGTSLPLGEIFLWFFKKITILQLYRNPLEKFGMLLPIIYAPLFGFGLFYLAYKIQNLKKRVLFLVLTIILLGVFHWPFFSGALTRFEKRDIRVVVPSSFKSANEAIPAGNHVILSIPVMGGASGFYKWQYGYKGVESSQYLFDYPVINIFYDATSFTGQLLIATSNNNLHNLIGLAQLFSADIVAYRKDTDVSAFGYNLDTLERSEKMINESNLTKIFDSKEASLWSLPQEAVVPLIYIPQSIKFGESPKNLITLLENHQFDPRSQVFICTDREKCNPYVPGQDLSQIRIQATPEKIEFTKISPVNYGIKVINSKGKFLLVLNNAYHPGWIFLVNGEQIDSNKHIVANGYANGFLIDKTGSFNISLKFAPEEKIQRFYKVSLFTISLGIIILFGLVIKALLK